MRADGTSDVGLRWAQENGLKQGQEVGLQCSGGQVSHLSQVLWCWIDRTNGIHPFLDVTCCCAVRPQPWTASKALPSRPCRRSSLVPFPLSYFRPQLHLDLDLDPCVGMPLILVRQGWLRPHTRRGRDL